MKANVYEQYGGPEVLQFKEVAKPIPADNEVLIRVYATTVNSGDWRARSLELGGFSPLGWLVFGFFKPRNKILGTELSGEIEAIGKNVTKFEVGELVYGFPGMGSGCHAEYVTMSEDGVIAHKPSSLSFEEAAAISFGGITALEFLERMGKIQPGEKVLINGASGAVGLAAVQLAKHFGAEVTGVCSTANLDLVRSVGADKVIDYTCKDFSRNGETYDIIVDAAGTAPWSISHNSLNQSGRLLLVNGLVRDMVRAAFQGKKATKRIVAGTGGGTAEQLRFLNKLIEAGKYRPIIDRAYPFEKIAEAHAYVDSGRKKGSVAITIAQQRQLVSGVA